ncbi:MAG: tetratricopeptide repeat protein [Verrucomicrobia bacterium]|nr:tetratricopeptide repeat protein [Verrucomicrobiota bacterium]
MVATCLAAVIIACPFLSAQESTSTPPVDLAKTAALEHLPQVSAALLRTQIQQEQDPAKKTELTQRLAALLVSGGRFEEALAVIATLDSLNDPTLCYWKGLALLGSGDPSSAKEIFLTLREKNAHIPGVESDTLALCLARALRGNNDPTGALVVLEKIPGDSPVAEDVLLERCTDLLALGKTEEALKAIPSSGFRSDEGKASASYLKALAAWRTGKIVDARKLFAAIPPVSPWIISAATLGEALCLSTSTNSISTLKGIELLEKRLDAVDQAPLVEEQFRLLDQLYAKAATPDIAMLKKWSGDVSKPARAKLASYYQAKGELRLGHSELAESVLDGLIKSYPADPLTDRATILLVSSKLQHGVGTEAFSLAADRDSATPEIRAQLAYLRGLAASSAGKPEEAKSAFTQASTLDPSLAQDALFNQAVLIAKTGRGSLDLSQVAQEMAQSNAGAASEEMQLQIALDLARRGEASGLPMILLVADKATDPTIKSRARLAASELNMKSGKGEAAISDLAKAVHENSSEPEREDYLNVFLKDTGRKVDGAAVIGAARAFLEKHPDSRFVPEVRLKLAEALLSSGDVQGARVEFEQLAASGAGTDLGRHALFLAAQSAARSMDPASIDDSLMLLERVAETGGSDRMVWQARLQEGALKNAQNLPLEALAIYDKILSSRSSGGTNASAGPDAELIAAALMAKGDTLHQLGAKDPLKEREALKSWQELASDPSISLRWRNQALCKSALILESLGECDAALATCYQVFKNPRSNEPEQLWHDKAAFEGGRLLESRKQWNDAVALYGQIVAEGGPRAEEAKARISKLRLENFLWEN